MSTPFVSSYYARLIILITEHGTTTCYGVPAGERCKQMRRASDITLVRRYMAIPSFVLGTGLQEQIFIL